MDRSWLLAIAAWMACPAAAQPDCGAWRAADTVDPGSVSNLLYDVAFSQAASGLAVGSWRGAAPAPMVQRLAGEAWVQVELPSTSGLGTRPMVEGVGPAGSELWVVGYVTTPYPTNNMPLVIRWDGAQWSGVQTPALRRQNTYPYADRGGFAYDVVGIAPNDIWVVGTAVGYGDASATSVGLALHFDGADWTDVEVPIVGNRSHSLDCVSASSSDNVWAVGHYRNVAGAYRALIVRWDGSRWSAVPNPGEGAGGGDAEAVLALAPDDVWISGSFNGGADHLIHWNGQSWDVIDAGLPGPFAAFAATAPDDIWASCAASATFYHFDGQSWTPVVSPEIPGSSYVLRGWGLAAAGPCDVWSVGAWSDGSVQWSLAEHLSPRDCDADLNDDGRVGFSDLVWLLSSYGTGGGGDVDCDGDTDFDDLVNLLVQYGT